MLSAIINSNTYKVEDILPDLAVALACYCEGDSSGMHEWYEPLVDAGDITSIVVYLQGRAYIVKNKDYSDLAYMPHIAVFYKGDWIGDTTVSSNFKFIYDESEDKPRLIEAESNLKTTVFN